MSELENCDPADGTDPDMPALEEVIFPDSDELSSSSSDEASAYCELVDQMNESWTSYATAATFTRSDFESRLYRTAVYYWVRREHQVALRWHPRLQVVTANGVLLDLEKPEKRVDQDHGWSTLAQTIEIAYNKDEDLNCAIAKWKGMLRDSSVDSDSSSSTPGAGSWTSRCVRGTTRGGPSSSATWL